MDRDLFVRRLSTVTVAVCLAAFATALAAVVSPDVRSRLGLTPAPEPPAYRIGGHVDVPSTVFAGSPATLILFGRSTCSACQRGAPTYQEAVSLAASHRIPAWFVTHAAERVKEVEFASGLGIAPERVMYIASGALRLRTVPLLMLVDREGRVEHLWEAVPDEADRTGMLQALSSKGSPQS